MAELTKAGRKFYEALEALWLEQTGGPLPLENNLALVLHSLEVNEHTFRKPHGSPQPPRVLVSTLMFYQQEELAIDSQEVSNARDSVDPPSSTPEGLQHNGDVHAARPPVQEHRVRQILPGEEET